MMEHPLRPSESDCCNSGCNPCILDIYEEQIKKWNSRTQEFQGKHNCMSPTTYTVFKLVDIEQHTHDTFLYTFSYVRPFNTAKPDPDDSAVIYKPGQHFLMKGCAHYDKNEQFTRAYTPIPLIKDPLKFIVVVKLYKDGLMSNFFKQLKASSETLWRGPYGSFELDCSPQYTLLIAQGTGVAPLFAIIKDILDSEWETFMKLLFCCRSERDILLRNELYELCQYWNFSYEVFLSSPGEVRCKYNETIHASRLNIGAINAYLEGKLESTRILICGSEGFNQNMLENVTECGMDKCRVFLF